MKQQRAIAHLEGYTQADRENKEQVRAWLKKAYAKALEGDLSMLVSGPWISCAADLMDIFTRSQHALDDVFKNLSK